MPRILPALPCQATPPDHCLPPPASAELAAWAPCCPGSGAGAPSANRNNTGFSVVFPKVLTANQAREIHEVLAGSQQNTPRVLPSFCGAPRCCVHANCFCRPWRWAISTESDEPRGWHTRQQRPLGRARRRARPTGRSRAGRPLPSSRPSSSLCDTPPLFSPPPNPTPSLHPPSQTQNQNQNHPNHPIITPIARPPTPFSHPPPPPTDHRAATSDPPPPAAADPNGRRQAGHRASPTSKIL